MTSSAEPGRPGPPDAPGQVRAGRPLGRTLHPGTGTGPVLRLGLPLSFWGGVDEAGTIVDRHHPQLGRSVAGQVLAMTSGRGSSSSSSVLAELLRAGAGPAAILLTEADPIVVLGVIVADELYGTGTPVVRLTPEELAGLPDGERVTVEAEGPSALVLRG